MEEIIVELKEFLNQHGFNQEDRRLNRYTRSLPGHMVVLNSEVLETLKTEKVNPKFKDDWKRMYPSFQLAIKNAKEDRDSRRLLVSNMSRFMKVWPCFTHVQFVYTHRNEFDIYVYMRSSDLAKFKDDCVFFTSLAKRFASKVSVPVTKMVVVFSHVHYQENERLATQS